MTNDFRRNFAIVPAAGHSARMGEPKLQLPVAGRPLIWRTLSAWQQSDVDRIVVVVRPGDGTLVQTIEGWKSKARSPNVEIVIPADAPLDMKASVQIALQHIEQNYAPAAADAFLVAPADMPSLSSAIVNRLIKAHASGASVIVPIIAGRQGHPVLLSWSLASDVYQLKENQGLNEIVARRQPLLVACEDLVAAGESPFLDIDTPDDYRQLTTDN